MRVCVRDISLVELLMTFRWRWETLAVAYHIWTFVCVASIEVFLQNQQHLAAVFCRPDILRENLGFSELNYLRFRRGMLYCDS